MSEQVPAFETTFPAEWHACPACQNTFYTPPNWPPIICPLCQQAVLTAVQDTTQPPSIELIVPPGLDTTRLYQHLSQFCKGVPFACPDFTADNLTKRLLLLYWPVWLTDANLKGEWDAMFGYDYQVQSSREQMGNAGWTSQSVIKTRVKEEPRKGFIERHYDNILSPALSAHTQRLNQLGQYDLHAAHTWHPANTEQCVVQKMRLSPHDAEASVKNELTKLAALDCRAASDAQHAFSYKFYGEFADMHWTQGLLPMFTTFYEDDEGNRHVVAINGQTGKIYAARMASIKKSWVLTGILFAIALIVLLFLYFAKVENLICFTPILILSFLPVIRAASWNTKEKAKPPVA